MLILHQVLWAGKLQVYLVLILLILVLLKFFNKNLHQSLEKLGLALKQHLLQILQKHNVKLLVNTM